VKLSLTKTVVETIQPAAKDVIIWDTRLTGFFLKVTPRGRKAFGYTYRVGHQTRRPMIGTYPSMGVDEARKQAVKWRGQVEGGNDPSVEKKNARAKPKGDGTVAALFDSYRLANAHLRSIDNIKRMFEKDILPVIGKMQAEAVTRADVNRLLDKVARRSPTSARLVRSWLSAFYTWALPRLPDSAVNPVTYSIRIKANPPRERALSDAEIRDLWQALENLPVWRGPIRLLILTGLRLMEVLDADWSEFNLSEGLWIVPASRMKGKKAHIVPITPEIRALLGDEKPKGRVFSPVRVAPNQANRIRAALIDHLQGPVPHWVIHDIRRTVATGMQGLGIRLEVTEALLAHSGASRSGVAGVYHRHDWLEEKRTALGRWANHVMQSSGNVVQLRA
jgi:integrase